ncbi:MAG: hypothetical protein K1W16_13920 [Lachnospiraceae bacterium]
MKISTFNDLLLTVQAKIKTEEELKDITSKMKSQVNELELSSFEACTYEASRDLFEQIQYYIDDKELLNKLSEIIETKKIKKYPELLKPTYYPEIDSLNISDSEKLRLDKAARWNFRNYVSKNNIEKLSYPLSINDLKLLKRVGVVEKKYDFRCKECGSSCTVISESDLERHKRFWELQKLEKENKITNEQLDELDQLDKNGFYEIYLYCDNDRECSEIEIVNKKELDEYMNNVEIIYKVAKSPDLRYEKL